MVAPPGDTPRLGAYGLTFSGMDDARSLLSAAPLDWPDVEVRFRHSGEPIPGRPGIEADAAIVPQAECGHARFDRRRRTATFVSWRKLGHADLVRPGLDAAGAVFARWLGRSVFHAGAFVLRGGGWAVPAQSQAGKSTMLAALERDGHGVLADDTVVIDRGSCFPGTRCLDLRPPSVEGLALGARVTPARHGTRERLTLSPVPSRVPLRGWVIPVWSEEIAVRRLRAVEAIESVVAAANPIRHGFRYSEPAAALELMSLPVFEFRRPADWDAMDEAQAALLDALLPVSEPEPAAAAA